MVVRGRAHIEPMERGKERIIVTEMPYQVYKGDGRGDGSGLMQKIVEQVQNGRLKEISDLRDESDKSGIRLVIELKRDAIPKVVLNKLYKHTPAADDVRREHGRARRRRAAHARPAADRQELRRPPARRHRAAHEVRAARDGGARSTSSRACSSRSTNIDEVIELIRGSSDPDAARDGLIERFELSRIQAQAILDLRLQRLTALETDEIKAEHADVVERIK